jgi:ankyrin repeat protein
MVPDYQLLDAAKHNDLQSAREAVHRGANVHARDLGGRSALYLACTEGHMPLAEFLVDLGADVDETFGKRRQTLLHWAAEQSSTGVATFLISHKANVNAQQSDGSTPLLLAAMHGHHYLVVPSQCE